MPKVLTISGMVIAALLFLVFLLDLVAGFPFKKASMWMDVGVLVCTLALIYMSWSTLRELK